MFSRLQARTVWRRTFPGVETVTLRSRGTSDFQAAYTDYAIAHAKQRPSDAGERTSSGVVEAGIRYLKWQIWQDALDQAGASAPKVGDVIRDSTGTQWLIQSVSRRLFGELHDCECVERV